MESIQTALLLAMIIMGLVEYLKMPLINTPRIVRWLIDHGFAYVPGDAEPSIVPRHLGVLLTTRADHVVIWFIPYITFILGLIMSMGFQVDLISQYIPGAGVWPARILTAIIIGCGSNLIHDITNRH